jgi:hypothetical protein
MLTFLIFLVQPSFAADLSCEQIFSVPDKTTLASLDSYTVAPGVTACLEKNMADAWKISWAQQKDPQENMSFDFEENEELPPFNPEIFDARKLEKPQKTTLKSAVPKPKWVHLICEGPYTYTYTETTTVEHKTSGYADAGSSTLSTPVTKTIQIRREIHFDENWNLFKYFGANLFEVDEEGAAQIERVHFDTHEIVVEFKVAKESKGKRAFSALTTMGLSELYRDRDTTKKGVLNRMTGTWNASNYSIPCSVIELKSQKF